MEEKKAPPPTAKASPPKAKAPPPTVKPAAQPKPTVQPSVRRETKPQLLTTGAPTQLESPTTVLVPPNGFSLVSALHSAQHGMAYFLHL